MKYQKSTWRLEKERKQRQAIINFAGIAATAFAITWIAYSIPAHIIM